MGKIRGSSRTCPECFEQFSGNKCCYCSVNFTIKNAGNKKNFDKNFKIRRTERVKRGRPDYYDIWEYERQARREKKLRAKRRLALNKQLKNEKAKKEDDPDYISSRMHLKTKKAKKKKPEEVPEPPKEEELEEIVLSKETMEKFDLILKEINRKIYASSWRVYID